MIRTPTLVRLVGGGMAVLVALSGCTPSDATAQARTEENRVRRGTLTETLVLTGELEAAVSAVVSVPRLPSWQTSIRWLAEDGIEVKEGDRVAELDNSSYASDIEEKRVALSRAEQDLLRHDEQTRADLAQREIDLLRRQNAYDKARLDVAVPDELLAQREREERKLAMEAARTELDKAQTLYESTREAAAAERQNLRIELIEKQREIAIAEQAIDTMTLLAPRDGILLVGRHPWEGRKLRTGDPVWVGFDIASIPEVSTLRIRARLFDVDDRRVEVGDPVRVRIDAYPDLDFAGEVTEVSAIAAEEPGTSLRRYFDVVIPLEGGGSTTLKPGLSVRVEVIAGELENVLIAPRGAIDFESEPPRLRLAGGGDTEIRVTSCNALECALEGDVEEGAMVR